MTTENAILPSFFNHFTMFPSSIVGESAGIRTLIPGVPAKQAHGYLNVVFFQYNFFSQLTA